MANIIGREAETRELQARYESHTPQFVAVYGRRRVGKTFLIDPPGKLACFSIKVEGISNSPVLPIESVLVLWADVLM